jgi:hypothetical protein
MDPQEFSAGASQLLVVYPVEDLGSELDPIGLFGRVAADAGARSNEGWRIVSIAVMPTRHSAVAFGREGSGFETKAGIVVVYGR